MRVGGLSIQNLSCEKNTDYDGRELGAENVYVACVLGEGLIYRENFRKLQRPPHSRRGGSGSPLLMATSAVPQVSQKDACDMAMAERHRSAAPTSHRPQVRMNRTDTERILQASQEPSSIDGCLFGGPGHGSGRGSQAGLPFHRRGCDISPYFYAALRWALALEELI